MTTTDESVLEFIGRKGRSAHDLSDRFPGFDVTRLVRARLVEISAHSPGEAVAHVHEAAPGRVRFVLTARGAEVVGIDLETVYGVPSNMKPV